MNIRQAKLNSDLDQIRECLIELQNFEKHIDRRLPSGEEIADAFVSTWVSRFGVPLQLVTDRGAQFESELFSHLSRTLGFVRLRTTAYNPKCNGLLERQHRTLKTILRARKGDWFQSLPIALFAMRITPSATTEEAPFTLVTGASILAPSMCFNYPKQESEACKYIQELAARMETLKFTPTRWNHSNEKQIPKELMTCKKVWVEQIA